MSRPIGFNHTKETRRRIREALRGPKSYRWKGGKPICPDCGIEINYGSTYCKRHMIRGERHYAWNGGRPKCADCGAEIKYGSTYCRNHAFIRERNPAWRGGHLNSYPPDFNNALKLMIRTRDNFTCQKCGRAETDEKIEFDRVLSVHHIDEDKSNCQEANLISLCLRCNLEERGFQKGVNF